MFAKSLIFVLMFSFSTFAQEQGGNLDELVPGQATDDVERDPAAIKASAGKRTYPGGADEEDLRVQSRIPEAPLRVDARGIQKEVYKRIYNEDMKDERQETVEE